MNLFDIFEERIQQIFEGGNAMVPLPFKKLAKRAVREMKRAAVKIDGRVVAPSLYTVEVNPADDAAIAPLYQQVTNEIVDFVAHEAQNDGMGLLCEPMVRFLANPSVRPGTSEVNAEVISPTVIEKLRAEEALFLQQRASTAAPMPNNGRGFSITNPAPGSQPPKTVPLAGQSEALAPEAAQPQAPVQARPASQPMAQQAFQPQAPAQQQPMQPQAPVQARPASQPMAQQPARPQPQTIPTQQPSSIPLPQAAQPQQQAPAQPAIRGNRTTACQLRDSATGRAWRIAVPLTTIGRDRATSDLVLEDTNVSRRHAELALGETGWHITDLQSTNGTRVNGMRIMQCDLATGDAITMGLQTLIFEEL